MMLFGTAVIARSRRNKIGNAIALQCVIVYFRIQRRHYFRVGASNPDGCQDTVVKVHWNGSLRATYQCTAVAVYRGFSPLSTASIRMLRNKHRLC